MEKKFVQIVPTKCNNRMCGILNESNNATYSKGAEAWVVEAGQGAWACLQIGHTRNK